jgi:hypothetical protein
MSYTDKDIEALIERANAQPMSGPLVRELAPALCQLLAQRDEARDEASDMRDEAYIDASAEKPVFWQSMHEAECAARHDALADLAAAQSRIHALEEALKPFADNAEHWGKVTVGDFRRARSILSPQKEGE